MASVPQAYFIGAGPGDVGLLTVRGREVLARAQVALFDAGVHPDIVTLGPDEHLLVGDGGEERLRDPDRIAMEIVRLAREGKTVARVTAGDPYLFGSGDEEVAFVARHGLRFEVVPGVIGSIAAGAYAGLPLSRRADASPSVALADARAGLALHDWSKLAVATDTLEVLLHLRDLEELVSTLLFHGRLPDVPVAVLADVARPAQIVVTGLLEDIVGRARSLSRSPVRVLVGEVAGKREGLRWYDRRPLSGKRVLVTRERSQATGTAALLRERGAEPVMIPTIELRPPRDPAAVERALGSLAAYGWVAFTSANGVHRAWTALTGMGKDARAFGSSRLAAIGPATAEALLTHGLRADVVAREFRGEGLATEILAALGEGAAPRRVLLLRAQEARDVLPEALRAAGCEVDIVAAYETRPPEGATAALRRALEGGALDAVTFSSSSTVTNLCDLVGPAAPELLAKLKVASIGPVTTATADKLGIRVDVTAPEYTLPGLVEALEASYPTRT